MKPLVQYVTTSDGVSIAFAVVGRGTPLILAADPPCSHVQLEWEQLPISSLNEQISARRMLLRFDSRGLGLSDRGAENFSLEARVLDLDAVAERVDAERFVLLGVQNAAPVAITYAIQHPGRLSHLILIDAVARGADFFVQTPQMKAMASLLAQDWEMFTENLGALAFGWGREETRRYGKFLRACVTRETLVRLYAEMAAADVVDQLPQVTTPTLLIHHSGIIPSSAARAKVLASSIPRARLTFIEGGWLDSWDDAMRAIDEFIGDSAPAAQASAPPREATTLREETSGIRTILFTDLVSSTALTQRLGDAKAQELVRAHNSIVRAALAAQGGSEIKHTGDGIMASFPTASGALECAVVIQRAVDARGDADLSVHIGLNAGEPVAEESDLFGTSVQLARRICDHAAAGQVLASNVVRELSAGKGFLFSDIGEVVPKGFEEPVRLYEVRWK